MMTPILRCAAVGALTLAAQAADFSYYMLGLAYAPETCVHSTARDARVCGPGRPGWIVQGLWAQDRQGRALEKCGAAKPLPANLVQTMLAYLPTEALIQQSWATYGTCTGLSPADYFAAIRRTRDSIGIPQRLQAVYKPLVLSPLDVEGEFNRANPGVPRDGFRTACYPDNGLSEIRICFDKDFSARPCSGAAQCTKDALRLAPMTPKR